VCRAERVSQERLFSRVSELYPDGELNYELLEIEKLTELYNKATKAVLVSGRVKERREWSSYGSGFASFVESWFYIPEKSYAIDYPGKTGRSFRGVSVFFSLLEPMFSVGESSQYWDESSGGSALPCIGIVDEYESDAVRSLSQDICQTIQAMGIPQARIRIFLMGSCCSSMLSIIGWINRFTLNQNPRMDGGGELGTYKE